MKTVEQIYKKLLNSSRKDVTAKVVILYIFRGKMNDVIVIEKSGIFLSLFDSFNYLFKIVKYQNWKVY